jgi:hypothetical protein
LFSASMHSVRLPRVTLPDDGVAGGTRLFGKLGIGVEVPDRQRDELTVTPASQQRSFYQGAEAGLARIDEARAFGKTQIADASDFDTPIRLDLPPCLIGHELVMLEGVVEGRSQYGPISVGGGSPSPLIGIFLLLAGARSETRAGLCQSVPPVPQDISRQRSSFNVTEHRANERLIAASRIGDSIRPSLSRNAMYVGVHHLGDGKRAGLLAAVVSGEIGKPFP